MKNLTLSKEKSPKCTSSSVLPPALVCKQYFDGRPIRLPMKGRGVAQTVTWTLTGLCFPVFWIICSMSDPFKDQGPQTCFILYVCVLPMLCPFSRDTGESYRSGTGYTMSSDAPSLTSCTAPTVMNRSVTRISEQGQPFLEEYLHQHGSLQLDFLFLLFVCFNISLLIILKKNKICVFF